MDTAEQAQEGTTGNRDEIPEESRGSHKIGQDMRSDNIRERLRQEDVIDTVIRKKKQWMKKIEEMPEERLVKSVYTEELLGKRLRGRPQKRWEDDLN